MEGSLEVGVGLRHAHFPTILNAIKKGEKFSVDFFEAISENFLNTRGRPFEVLMKVREHYDMSLHGVSLSIASFEDLNWNYLQSLKELYDLVRPKLVSDHLCWTGLAHSNTHNLLPFAYNQENLEHVASKVDQVQDFLERPLAFENLSAYMTLTNSEMSEAQFLRELSFKTGCQLLLDVNNIYVNSVNQGFDPLSFFEHIPLDCVSEVHLAGHTDMGDFLFDTHGEPVKEDVWKLYEVLCQKGQFSTLIEWDENIPDLSIVLEEAMKARKIQKAAL